MLFCLQDEPFTSHLPETLFNIARYLLHMLVKEIPPGVSRVYLLNYKHIHSDLAQFPSQPLFE